MKKRCLLVLLTTIFSLSGCSKYFPSKDALRVGFGRTDITPSMSVPLAGYGQTHKRMSTFASDQLMATCVAITDSNDETLLLISQDTIDSLWEQDARAAVSEATGVPIDHIMVAATHTHGGPDADSSLECIQVYKQEEYLPQLTAAAVAAMEDRSRAVPYTGESVLEKMNAVRHYLLSDGSYGGDNFGDLENNAIVEQAEPKDAQLQVIRFERKDKQDVVMVNWQAHPTLNCGSAAQYITSDFVGATRKSFEGATGDLFIYFTGAAGNQNARSKLTRENLTKNYKQYGILLSDAVKEILSSDMERPRITPLKTKTMTYTGKVNHSMEDKLDQAQEIVQLYNEAGKQEGNILAKKYGFSSVYHANGVILRSKLGQTLDMGLHVASLGGISFVAAPYEMFAAHGTYIKENSPSATTFVISCCNGRFGYIPTTKAYDYGCYEAHSGRFAKGTGEELATLYVDTLTELNQ